MLLNDKKTPVYEEIELVNLRHSFQCDDILKIYRPNNPGRGMVYFTDGQTAVFGAFHNIDGEQHLVLRQPLGPDIGILLKIENQYEKNSKLRITGLTAQQLISLSEQSKILSLEDTIEILQAWDKGVNQRPAYFCVRTGAIIFKR